MSPRTPKHLHDALTAARHAVDFAARVGAATYPDELLVRSAIERQLEILGEACRRALDEDAGLRQRVPDCVLAVGLRNRIVHAYDRLDHALIFETVVKDLPGLIDQLVAELATTPPPAGDA